MAHHLRTATPIVISTDAHDNSAPSKSVVSQRFMPSSEKTSGLARVLLPADSKEPAIPIWLAREAGWLRSAPLTAAQKTWVEAQGTRASGGLRHVLVPAPEGRLAGVVLWLEEQRSGRAEHPELAIGHLPRVLPPGLYHLADAALDRELATVAW